MGPPTWAIVTGSISGIITLDFDGEIGTATLEKLQLRPHRRTPSGGYHADFRHPGWHVPTLNGKSKRVLCKQWPGLDIRGDGGYVLFTGNTAQGSYTWLQEFNPYELGLLPDDLRSFLSLEAPSEESRVAMPHAPSDEVGSHAVEILALALKRAVSEGRNNSGFWLACQLRDAGLAIGDVEAALRLYTARVSSENTKGAPEQYTEAEAMAAVRQAFTRSAREPWRKQDEKERTSSDSLVPKQTPAYENEPYCVHNGEIWGFRCLRGHVWMPFQITNFTAAIEKDRVLDDGAEETRSFTVRAEVNSVEKIIVIGAKDFRSMNWVTEKLGGMAIVYPGQPEHARAAIQYLSREIPTIRSFCHTGWREINGELLYLHAAGAIGAEGSHSDVQVNLKEFLPNYSLPVPPAGNDRVRAIRASLQILEIAPDRITFPLLAAAYRATLGSATFSIHVEGPSGQGKSQLAALIQQHFGPAMDSDHLPASWDDTALAGTTLAYYAKDGVLVVDDLVISGNAARQQKLNAEADRLFRSQANSSGRRRVTTEGKLRSSHPPRGLIVSTGEHAPSGKSLNARMIIIPLPKGAVIWTRLTESQNAATRGEFAASLASFIQWVAPRLSALQSRMDDVRVERRKGDVGTSAPHQRTPDNLESLFFGIQFFLEFARESDAISEAEFRVLLHRGKVAFEEVGKNELCKHSTNEPLLVFLRYVRTAILMGQAHLVSPTGGAPDSEAPWGWQRASDNPDSPRMAQGARIGWLKGEEVCLDPEASFQIAAKMAHSRGETIPGTLESLKRDLRDGGYTRVDEKRRTLTVRRRFHGQDFEVLCLTLKTFEQNTLEGADDADKADKSFS